MNETPLDPGAEARGNTAEVQFDHHSPRYAQHSHEIYGDLRARQCPVVHTEAHGGFFLVSGYECVSRVARDDVTFSSHNDLEAGPRKGIVIPPNPIRSGMIETDPPRFSQQRRAANPWFSPSAVANLIPEINEYAAACVDKIIGSGSADLSADLASPVPAMLTVRMLGVPMEDWPEYADVMHRGIYTSPDSPEREEVQSKTMSVAGQLHQLALERRADPRDDLISFFARLEVEGEPLATEEVFGNAFLVLAGGVDTTTGLLLHTFMHLHKDRAARQYLLDDLDRLQVACEEYLRYVSPVQGLARTVTRPVEVGGTRLEADDRVWVSWASANLDPSLFDAPEEIRLDRTPNRHAAFGLGAHRCIGSNVARAVWTACVREVLTRLPDYEVDEPAVQRYPSIGVVNGYINMPVTFTPRSPRNRAR